MPSCIQTGGLRGNQLHRAAIVPLTARACGYYDFKIGTVLILVTIRKRKTMYRFNGTAYLRLASERPSALFLLLGYPGNATRTGDMLCAGFSLPLWSDIHFSPRISRSFPRRRQRLGAFLPLFSRRSCHSVPPLPITSPISAHSLRLLLAPV